jgi:hypothetical protein
MARQKGIIKLKGTIGDITFYKNARRTLAARKAELTLAELQVILRFKELVRMVPSLESWKSRKNSANCFKLCY